MNYEEIIRILDMEIRRYMRRVLSGKPCPSCHTAPMVILERYHDENDCQPPDRIIKCMNCQKSFVEKLEQI